MIKEKLELLKMICEDNGKYREHYYGLSECKNKGIAKCYGEYMNGETEHKYSNIYSCVYDYCKQNNINENISLLTELIKEDMDLYMQPKHILHNFKVKYNIYESEMN